MHQVQWKIIIVQRLITICMALGEMKMYNKKVRKMLMSHYVVNPVKYEEYEKNYKMPMVNILAGFVWSIPIHQKLYPDASTDIVVGLCIAIVVLYVALSYIPFLAILPAIGGGIMYTGLLWVPVNWIPNNVVRIIAKILVLLFVIMVELAVAANATMSWIVD